MHDLPVEGSAPTDLDSTQGLPDFINRTIACLGELGENYVVYCSELSYLQQRLVEGRFHLAVLGQFKRGKSTLLNALLGDDLLPTDILPVTAIPTFIHHDNRISGQVHFFSDLEPISFTATEGRSLSEFLRDYVTESGNPRNQRQVERVEIGHPAELLKQGVVLIDTPGIGSTLKHNTEVAHQILPQCDAALFLVSPDPPITEMELGYLKQIKRQLPRTFFLLNKVDFLSDDDQLASLKFLAEQLAPLCEGVPQVLPVSARTGLNARLAGDASGWRDSGMLQVEENLVDFFAREKQQTLHLALRRRCGDLVNEAIMQLQLSLSALKLPIVQLEERIAQFRQSLPAVERERQAVQDVLAGDLKRAIARLSEEIEKLRNRAKEQITVQVENSLSSIRDPEEMERLVRRILAEEIAPFFTPAMRTLSDVVRHVATDLLILNQKRSNALIEQVRQTAAELFEIPYHAPAADSSYTSFTAPSWSSDLFVSDMDPLGQRLSRKIFTQKYRRRKTVERLREECRKLINQNVEQINWTVRRSLDESFRLFGSKLQEQLEKTIEATRTAMEVALERSESHSRETAGREIRLKQTLGELEALSQELQE